MKNMLNYIHESNLIEGIDNSDFDKQGLLAWDFLKTCKKVNISTICKVQKINTLLQKDLQPHQRGYTRSMSKVNVFIGGESAPSWWLVDDMLGNWIIDMEENMLEITPKEMHIRFEHIHPFVDGNGRTGRMLMWWHEIKLGKKPTIILNKNKQDYYEWFEGGKK